MTVYIALLRAVNVAGQGKASMAELRQLLTGLGFNGVRSLLNTGNLVFSGDALAGGELEARLEQAAGDQIGLRTDFMVRTGEELASVVARNPFPDEAQADPGHLVVMFLKSAPDASSVEALRKAISGPEVVRAEGWELYVTYPAGIGRSKLTNALIDRKLGTRATGRNWNTVLKLLDVARGAPG